MEAWRFGQDDQAPVRLGDSGPLGAPVQAVVAAEGRVVVATGLARTPGWLTQWDATDPAAGRIDWQRATPEMNAPATALLLDGDRLWAANDSDPLRRFLLSDSGPPVLEATFASRVKASSVVKHAGAAMAVVPRVRTTAEPTPNLSQQHFAVVRLPLAETGTGPLIPESARVDLPRTRWFNLSPRWALEEGGAWGMVAWPRDGKIHRLRFDPEGMPSVHESWHLDAEVVAGGAMFDERAWLVMDDRELVSLDPGGAMAPLTRTSLPQRFPRAMVGERAERLWIGGSEGEVLAVDVSAPAAPVVRGLMPAARVLDVAVSDHGTWLLYGDRMLPLDASGHPSEGEAIPLPLELGRPLGLMADGHWLFLNTEAGLYPVDLSAATPDVGPSLYALDDPVAQSRGRASGRGWVAAVSGETLLVWPTRGPGPIREMRRLGLVESSRVLHGGEDGLWLISAAGIRHIDLSDPLAPRVGGTITLPAGVSVTTMGVRGDLGLIGTLGGSLIVMDVRDPEDARVLGTLDAGARVADVAMEEGGAWVVGNPLPGGVLSWLDLRLPSLPEERARLPLGSAADRLVSSSEGIYVLSFGLIERFRGIPGPPGTPRASATPRPSATATGTPAGTRPPSATPLQPTATSTPNPSALWLPWAER